MIRVLVVEDNKIKYELIKEKLVAIGVTAICDVENIYDAETELKSSHFDILILDMQLPMRKLGKKSDNAGLSLLKTLKHSIKKNKSRFKIPNVIIGLTEHPEIFKKQAKSFSEQRVFAYQYNNCSDDWAVQIISSIEEYVATKEVAVEKKEAMRIIYSIHGIMTFGEWQTDFDNHLIDKNRNEIIHVKFQYNFFPIISFLIPYFRKTEVNSFVKELLDLQSQYPNSEVDVIAHSFGTYILKQAAEEMSLISSPNFNRFILCGSVLKPKFPFSDLINKYTLNGILNECALSDFPLILSHSVAWGLGMGGRVGFKGTYVDAVKNQYREGGHSSFFNKKTFDEWLLYLDTGITAGHDARKKVTLYSAIKNTVISFLPHIFLLGIISFLIIILAA
ncbi:response regulator [Psychromonas sp. Urea-02u-13]|uniref:response regulator n=1 Tax=Psychromonas sp. Urea-02u-13 TaxID=2058326 RepID=UPI000C34061D|nr:response regulator [Psychromonas sp. Urea-02u-13]PKG38002.1 hypothetical protein CXF74_15960 [Psychromonas sp. Urea-02u-13]